MSRKNPGQSFLARRRNLASRCEASAIVPSMSTMTTPRSAACFFLGTIAIDANCSAAGDSSSSFGFAKLLAGGCRAGAGGYLGGGHEKHSGDDHCGSDAGVDIEPLTQKNHAEDHRHQWI